MVPVRAKSFPQKTRFFAEMGLGAEVRYTAWTMVFVLAMRRAASHLSWLGPEQRSWCRRRHCRRGERFRTERPGELAHSFPLRQGTIWAAVLSSRADSNGTGLCIGVIRDGLMQEPLLTRLSKAALPILSCVSLRMRLSCAERPASQKPSLLLARAVCRNGCRPYGAPRTTRHAPRARLPARPLARLFACLPICLPAFLPAQ